MLPQIHPPSHTERLQNTTRVLVTGCTGSGKSGVVSSTKEQLIMTFNVDLMKGKELVAKVIIALFTKYLS